MSCALERRHLADLSGHHGNVCRFRTYFNPEWSINAHQLRLGKGMTPKEERFHLPAKAAFNVKGDGRPCMTLGTDSPPHRNSSGCQTLVCAVVGSRNGPQRHRDLSHQDCKGQKKRRSESML